MAYFLLCDAIFWGFDTRFHAYVFSKHLCFFASRFLPHFLVGFAPFFMPERIGLRKLFAKLGYCRTLCSFLRGQLVNCSQRSLTMLLSKLTPDTAKLLTRPEEQCFQVVRLIAINRAGRSPVHDQQHQLDYVPWSSGRPIRHRLIAISRVISLWGRSEC
jgi:hypothetical protein